MDNRFERRRIAATRTYSPRKVPFARWVLVILGLLAMSAQSLLVQTHVHGRKVSREAFAVAHAPAQPASIAALPAKDAKPSLPPQIPDDALKCPLCQQWHGAGQFTAPSSALITLPGTLHLTLAVLDDPALAVTVLSHPWHGRAPPKA